MRNEFFNGFSGRMKNCDEKFIKDKKSDSSSSLIAKAQGLGISVGRFYTFNEDGSIKSVDTAGLNAEIQKVAQEQKKLENKDTDTFSTTSNVEDAKLTEDERKKADTLQNSVDKEYADALMQYANSFNTDADSTTTEGKLADKWAEISEDSLKYIGVDASDTAVLEGAKEFISRIYSIVNETKSTIDKKETYIEENELSMSVDADGKDAKRDNKMEVYSTYAEDNTNPFADIYLKSAMDTFQIDESDRMNAVA